MAIILQITDIQVTVVPIVRAGVLHSSRNGGCDCSVGHPYGDCIVEHPGAKKVS